MTQPAVSKHRRRVVNHQIAHHVTITQYNTTTTTSNTTQIDQGSSRY